MDTMKKVETPAEFLARQCKTRGPLPFSIADRLTLARKMLDQGATETEVQKLSGIDEIIVKHLSGIKSPDWKNRAETEQWVNEIVRLPFGA